MHGYTVHVWLADVVCADIIHAFISYPCFAKVPNPTIVHLSLSLSLSLSLLLLYTAVHNNASIVYSLFLYLPIQYDNQ